MTDGLRPLGIGVRVIAKMNPHRDRKRSSLRIVLPGPAVGHVLHIHSGATSSSQLLASSNGPARPRKPVQPQMVVLGSVSLGGKIIPVDNIAESLQVAFDARA